MAPVSSAGSSQEAGRRRTRLRRPAVQQNTPPAARTAAPLERSRDVSPDPCPPCRGPPARAERGPRALGRGKRTADSTASTTASTAALFALELAAAHVGCAARASSSRVTAAGSEGPAVTPAASESNMSASQGASGPLGAAAGPVGLSEEVRRRPAAGHFRPLRLEKLITASTAATAALTAAAIADVRASGGLDTSLFSAVQVAATAQFAGGTTERDRESARADSGTFCAVFIASDSEGAGRPARASTRGAAASGTCKCEGEGQLLLDRAADSAAGIRFFKFVCEADGSSECRARREAKRRRSSAWPA